MAVAPAAGAGAGVALLDTVVLWLVVIALAVLWFQIIRKVLIRIADIRILRPHPFGWLHGPISTVDRWIRGVQEGCERAVTWTLHEIMWSVSTGYKQTRDLAGATFQLHEWVMHHTTRHAGAQTGQSISPRIKTLEREYKGIDHRVDELERHEHAKRGVGAAAGAVDTKTFDRYRHGINDRISKLEREYQGIEHGQTHVGTKTGTKTGAKTATKPRAVPRAHTPTRHWADIFTRAGLAALGVALLARIGAGWVRCTNMRRVGRRICGVNPSWIDEFLAATLLIVGVQSYRDFVKEAQAGFELGLEGLEVFIAEYKDLASKVK